MLSFHCPVLCLTKTNRLIIDKQWSINDHINKSISTQKCRLLNNCVQQGFRSVCAYGTGWSEPLLFGIVTRIHNGMLRWQNSLFAKLHRMNISNWDAFVLQVRALLSKRTVLMNLGNSKAAEIGYGCVKSRRQRDPRFQTNFVCLRAIWNALWNLANTFVILCQNGSSHFMLCNAWDDVFLERLVPRGPYSDLRLSQSVGWDSSRGTVFCDVLNQHHCQLSLRRYDKKYWVYSRN